MASKLFLLLWNIFVLLVTLESKPHRRHVQAVSVYGTLYCGELPMKGVVVKLIEKDYGDDRDDFLNEMKTDHNGDFHVTGATTELTHIEPAIKIYHDCNDGKKKCQKRLYWTVPHKYVTTNLTAIPVFQIGKINLEITFGNEERDCLH